MTLSPAAAYGSGPSGRLNRPTRLPIYAAQCSFGVLVGRSLAGFGLKLFDGEVMSERRTERTFIVGMSTWLLFPNVLVHLDPLDRSQDRFPAPTAEKRRAA